MSGLPAHRGADDPDEAERRLLAHLLLYHCREGKPAWWRYFDLRGKPLDDLIDDRDAIAGLDPRRRRSRPVPYKRSLDYTSRSPRRSSVSTSATPRTRRPARATTSSHVDEDHVVLRRGNDPAPPRRRSRSSTRPSFHVAVLREALMALAASLLAGDGRFRPRARSCGASRRASRRARSGEDIDALVSATLGLDHSVLPVQGPPGTGKTFRGARMIVAALAAGRRVGITAPSHAAIQNLLRDVEQCAHEQSRAFTGIYKGDGYDSPHGLIDECRRATTT